MGVEADGDDDDADAAAGREDGAGSPRVVRPEDVQKTRMYSRVI